MALNVISGFKNLGDKSKESKVLRKPRSEDRLLHFSAGLHILHRYEESWYQLHRRTKDCAQAAQLVDGDIVMLSALWDKRRSALAQLEEQLQGLPTLIRELDTITTSLVELNAEHAQKVSHMEQLVQQKLKAKQKEYEEAFHQDMEKYLSSGFLTHREPATANVCELDHITVTNTSDQQALDDFLNSSSEDTSLWSGTEDTCSSGSLSVGQQRAGGQQPEEQSSEADSEEEERGSETDSEEPLVEADHEEVLPDASP